MAVSNLKAQFQAMDQQLLDATNKGLQIPEGLRLRIYGLAKQSKEGDCKMPMPPSSNTVLRSKWDSWMSYKGVPQESAMQEHITIVHSLLSSTSQKGSVIANAKPTTSSASSTNAGSGGGIKKQGILYKQRDVFKGWRPRHFVLQDSLLHYYIDADDPVPRKTLDVSNCAVIAVKPTTVDGTEYFPFVITHPKSPVTYNLASDSKAEADSWVTVITEAAAEPLSPSNGSSLVVDRLLERRPSPSDVEDVSKAGPAGLVDSPETTLENIPKKYATKVELAVEAMLGAVSNDAESTWETMFEKNGVVGKKKVGDAICVRGDSLFPFSLVEVFRLIMDADIKKEIDPQMDSIENIDKFSTHTWVDYLKYKPVWPTSPRDFTNLVHWRLLTNHTVVIVSFSEKMDDKKPIDEGVVRAELILGGYVLRTTSSGTMVNYVVQSDLKGTLPQTVVRYVSTAQPLVLASMKKMLEKQKKERKGRGPRVSAVATIQELRDVVEKISSSHAMESSGNEIVEIFGDGNSAAMGSTLPPPRKTPPVGVVPNLPEPKKRDALKSKLNTISGLILLLPPLLYYVTDSNYRGLSFLAGLWVAVRYLVRLQLGEPLSEKLSILQFTAGDLFRRLPHGKVVIRFPVDIGKLLRYLDVKREQSELEITITHICLKAIALTLTQVPSMNGHIIMGRFYPNPNSSKGVDLSLLLDVSDKDSVVVNLVDVDKKPLEFLSDEIQTRAAALRAAWPSLSTTPAAKNPFLLTLPDSISSYLSRWLFFLEGQLRVNFPPLGLVGGFYGVCTVISAPTQDGESGLDLSVQLDSDAVDFNSTAPVTVTIGGLRILPQLDTTSTAADSTRKLTGSPVLNLTAVIDTRVGTLSDARMFCSKLQSFLSDPVTAFEATSGSNSTSSVTDTSNLKGKETKKKGLF